MKKIHTTPLEEFFPPEEIELIKARFSEEHHCHRNCWEFCEYYRDRFKNIRFVTVSLAAYKGEAIPALAHAVIKIGKQYFDPTLETLFEFYVDYECTFEEITTIFETENACLIPFVPRKHPKTKEWYRYRGTQKEVCPPYTL